MHWYDHEDLVPRSVKYVAAAAAGAADGVRAAALDGVAEAARNALTPSVLVTTRELKRDLTVNADMSFSFAFASHCPDSGPGRYIDRCGRG
jgi:hypothetical protein